MDDMQSGQTAANQKSPPAKHTSPSTLNLFAGFPCCFCVKNTSKIKVNRTQSDLLGPKTMQGPFFFAPQIGALFPDPFPLFFSNNCLQHSD